MAIGQIIHRKPLLQQECMTMPNLTMSDLENAEDCDNGNGLVL